MAFKDWISSIADQTIKIRLHSLLSPNFKVIEIKTNKKDSKECILGAGITIVNFENANKRLLNVNSVMKIPSFKIN